VLDAFHVVKLAGQALDEVRRRVQQQTLHRRGLKEDPLYKVRRTLLTGDEHLTDRQRERLDKYLPIDDPNGEVEVTWSVYQQVRSIYPRREPVHWPQARREAPRHAPHLPDPRGQATRQDSAPLARGDPGLLRNRRRQQRRDRSDSTASSRRPGGWPTASATSPTTASGSCSPPTAHAPTNADHRTRPNHADLGRAPFRPPPARSSGSLPGHRPSRHPGRRPPSGAAPLQSRRARCQAPSPGRH
jgi:Transposase